MVAPTAVLSSITFEHLLDPVTCNMNYVLRRIALLIPILFAILTVVFSFLRLIPGDPVEAMLGEGAASADVAALRKELLLDQPIYLQYVKYVRGILHGDLGFSWNSRQPVVASIASRLPATL